MNEFETDKNATLVISELAKEGYGDLAKPSFKEVGTGAGYIARFAANLIGRPFEHLSKRLEHFWDQADKEYLKKVNSIPENKRIEPSLDVSLKTIQAMQSRIANNDLRSLFINLLVSASDSRVEDGVMPSYPSLLTDLTSDEAKLLVRLSETNRPNPFFVVSREVKVNENETGEIVVIKHLSKLAFEANCSYPKNIGQYIDNLARLNIIEIPALSSYSDEKIYDDLESDPVIQIVKTELEKQYGTQIKYTRKMIRLTNLGEGLCKACKIDQLTSRGNG